MSPHPVSELPAVAYGSNDQVRDVAELQGVEGGFSPVTGPLHPDPWPWNPTPWPWSPIPWPWLPSSPLPLAVS